MDQSVQQSLLTKEKKIYTGSAAKILNLLGNGCLPAEAARCLGIDESYISQLKAEPDFVEQVNALVANLMAKQSKIDNNYTAIEEKLSEKLLNLTEYMHSPDQILRTLKFANDAKRKLAPINPATAHGNTVTNNIAVLVLPSTIASKFVVSPNNEVLSVDGKELTTLPSANLNNLVKKHKEELAKLPAKFKNGPGQTDPFGDL